MPSSENQWPKNRHLLALTDAVGGNKRRRRIGPRAIVGRLHEPSSNIVERLPAFRTMFKDRLQVRFLFVILPS